MMHGRAGDYDDESVQDLEEAKEDSVAVAAYVIASTCQASDS